MLFSDDFIVASSTENGVTTDSDYGFDFNDATISAEEVSTLMNTPVWTTTAAPQTTTPNINTADNNNSTRRAKWRRRNNPNRVKKSDRTE